MEEKLSNDAIERWIAEYTAKQSQCDCLDIDQLEGRFIYCDECNDLELRVNTLRLSMSGNADTAYWKDAYNKMYDMYLRESDDALTLRIEIERLSAELTKQQYLTELYLEQALAAHKEKKYGERITALPDGRRIVSSRGPRNRDNEEVCE